MARKSVDSPTPANVSRKAQRDSLAMSAVCSFEKAPKVASSDTARKPSTNFGNFAHRNASLLSTVRASPLAAQEIAWPRTPKPVVELRVVLASTAILPACSDHRLPAATASAVLSIDSPAHRP